LKTVDCKSRIKSRLTASNKAGLALLTVFLLLIPAAALADGEPEVLAELERTKIYQGESVRYTVTLNHAKNPAPPELLGFEDFDVSLLGSTPQNFRQTMNINGRVTKIERYGMQYTYRLTPRKAGRLIVPGPVAAIGGKTLQGPQLALAVIAPRQQDVVILKLDCRPESVYPMQPFEVTLSVLVRDLPDPYSERDPVDIQRAIRSQPPVLQIPWALDEQLPEGVQPRRGGERWRQQLQSSGAAGFNINGLAARDIFSMFDDDSFFGGRFPSVRGPRLMVFRPQPTRVSRNSDGGHEVGYWQYDFKRQFTPKRIGQYQFGPINLKGRFLTGIDDVGKGIVTDIYAIAEPVALTVKDVPLVGRPESYIGAVGSFQIGADLAPKKAKVGDPMTFTLTIAGEGTLDDATAPDLASVAEIAERFKVYEATEEGQADRRQFTYSLRPLGEGVEQFPPVPLSYFDVNTEQYVTLRTEPIPIEVSKADKLTSRQIVGSRLAGSNGGEDVEVRREGVFANVTDPRAVRDESIRPGRWLAGLGGAAGLYVVMAAAVGLLRLRGGDVALRRRQSATSTARRRMRQASAELKAARYREGADHVQSALTGLVADMLDLPEAGLTPRDVERKLQDHGVEADLAGRVHAVLETCDAARYGASDATVDNLAHEAEALLQPLSRQLKSRRRSR